MKVLDLLVVASMPIIKLLLITAIGSLLAIDRVDVLRDTSRKYLNKLVYFVYNPAFVGSSLAQTVTYESLRTLWFMPVNVLITNLLGSALGWVLVKVTRAPRHLKGLIIGSSSAGNLGNLPIIIIPALCKEKSGPFGAPDVCYSYGMAYASLSMALGAIICWSYAFNIVRLSALEFLEKEVPASSRTEVSDELNASTSESYVEPLLRRASYSLRDLGNEVPSSSSIKNWIIKFLDKISLKELLAPSTLAVIFGFIIGMIPALRNLLIGNEAVLHIIEDSIYLVGDAAVPAMTLILGASLVGGIKGSRIQHSVVMGIIAVRYIFLPLLGILIVRGAVHFGIIQFNPLFMFVLLLQYAVPPAMNISTMTEMFGTVESESSVIMLWTYALSPIALTLWCTLFLWLVSS
ncbi:protein PIN-LIKES 3-like [Chenopodium quinoa]|uniref:protein PIN-LIKES 3-like n=1 Tax=Chenopodium quinoa TaxID=63459 RepID=UPI000B7750A8|nr:protein PIN-LIKES 3-like [Chenopodium quinoa]